MQDDIPSCYQRPKGASSNLYSIWIACFLRISFNCSGARKRAPLVHTITAEAAAGIRRLAVAFELAFFVIFFHYLVHCLRSSLCVYICRSPHGFGMSCKEAGVSGDQPLSQNTPAA